MSIWIPRTLLVDNVSLLKQKAKKFSTFLIYDCAILPLFLIKRGMHLSILLYTLEAIFFL
jgi:hypothetical protein